MFSHLDNKMGQPFCCTELIVAAIVSAHSCTSTVHFNTYLPLCSQTPRRLRSAFIKAEDQAAVDAAAGDDGLVDMEQIPTGRQTRLELRRLKLASRLADSDDAADEVEDADDDDPDVQVCDLPSCVSNPSPWSNFRFKHLASIIGDFK